MGRDKPKPDANVPRRGLSFNIVKLPSDLLDEGSFYSGNNVKSTNELAKVYYRPIVPEEKPNVLSADIIIAHDKLIAKRKLTLILGSKSAQEVSITVGDIVNVFPKRYNENRGKCMSYRPVLSYDISTHTITVPSSAGRTTKVTVKDVRPSTLGSDLASSIQEAIYQLDTILDGVIDELVRPEQAHYNEEEIDDHHYGR